MESIAKGVLSVAAMYMSHYGSVKMYDHFCVPDGFWGFLSGTLTTASPMCSVALKVAEHTSVSYSSAITVGLFRFLLDRLV